MVQVRARTMLLRWARAEVDSWDGVRVTGTPGGQRSGSAEGFVRSDYLTVCGLINGLGLKGCEKRLARAVFRGSGGAEYELLAEAALVVAGGEGDKR